MEYTIVCATVNHQIEHINNSIFDELDTLDLTIKEESLNISRCLQLARLMCYMFRQENREVVLFLEYIHIYEIPPELLDFEEV